MRKQNWRLHPKWIAAIVVLVLICVVGLWWVVSRSGQTVEGIPTDIPVASGKVSNQVTDGNTVSFSVDVNSDNAVTGVLDRFDEAGYSLEDSTEGTERSTYIVKKDGTTVILSLENVDGKSRLLYTVTEEEASQSADEAPADSAG